MITRREFLASGLVLPFVPKSDSGRAVTFPRGELEKRINLCARRLVLGGTPEFTDDFIVADVVPEPGRRFTEYSGDLSGRYVGALASLPIPGQVRRLDALVERILDHQRPDGRFGDPAQSFSDGSVGPKHMALLWGNGRLLVGLIEYIENAGMQEELSKKVLAASLRLGDFFAGVRQRCSEPEVRRRLEGQGAMGFICFTQWTEALAALSRHAGARRRFYLETAKAIVPLLQPRGVQHSHGYLTTLRGMVHLYQQTRDPALLQYVETAAGDLADSADATVYGGVLEYFGWNDRGMTDSARRELYQKGGRSIRDEGCSEADYVRLNLDLWTVTGKPAYLERAELCLVNAFYFNQFKTGDFGHHVTFERGFKPTESLGRAWWCCTMHGYRAFRDVMNSVATGDDDETSLHLFADIDYYRGDLSVEMRRAEAPSGAPGFSLKVKSAPGEPHTLRLRAPSWAVRTLLRLNSEPARTLPAGGVVLRRQWKAGDRIDLEFECRERLLSRQGRELRVRHLEVKPVEAALFYGPWLLAADEELQPDFFGELWQSSTVHLPDPLSRAAAPDAPKPDFSIPTARFQVAYRHPGFGAPQTVTLRPISEQTGCGQRIVAAWLNYTKA